MTAGNIDFQTAYLVWIHWIHWIGGFYIYANDA